MRAYLHVHKVSGRELEGRNSVVQDLIFSCRSEFLECMLPFTKTFLKAFLNQNELPLDYLNSMTSSSVARILC